MGKKAVSYLLHVLAALGTFLLLAAAIVSWRASFVSPERGEFWAVAALALPVILMLNIGAFVWWLVRGRWVLALVPVVALALNMGYISSMIRVPRHPIPSAEGDLRVMTLNANGFRRMGGTGASARAVAALARRERSDVVCLQEFGPTAEWSPERIAALFAPELPHAVSEGSQAMLSRWPVLDHYYLRFPDTNNDFLWADIALPDDTIRVFSVHLQTSGVSALRHRFRKDYNRDAPVDLVVGALERNSEIRARQVDAIRAAIDSARYPVVLTGDFNDTPSSYVYRRMDETLTDGFRKAGSGWGGTFRYVGGLLRIDYIFYGDAFEAALYRTLPDDVSDHKAVVADLRLRP